jgi:hypothetical protein
VISPQVPQLAFAAVDLVVQVVDERQGRRDVTDPRLRQCQTGQQPSAAGAEQVADRARLAEGHKVAWMRLLSAVRWRTRCRRHRARSRSARTPG